MDGNTSLIHLENINFSYSSGQLVLDDVNLTMEEGARIALKGGNGAGKTTLFHIILGLIRPLSGSVTVMGRTCVGEEDFKQVRRQVGLVFQDPDDQLFCPTVIEDVAFGPLNMGLKSSEAIERADSTLSSLGISHLRDRVPYRLSGGEKRLVSVATVLSMKPDVLLLDEPTVGLDQWVTERLIRVIRDYPCRGLLLISHDSRIADALTTRSLVLKGHKIEEECLAVNSQSRVSVSGS